MTFSIVRPRHKALHQVIDYFLFIQAKGSSADQHYTTYPNTNCCLALYRSNQVTWNQRENTCLVQEASTSEIHSRLYGWHNQPFKASIAGEMDQVCILFKATGLAHFTLQPLHQIAVADDPFVEIFGPDKNHFSQRLFATSFTVKRTQLLEDFLLQKWIPRPTDLVRSYLDYTSESIVGKAYRIKDFCQENYISESTFFRSCLELVGESPRAIKQKHRFRLFLKQLDEGRKLTDLAYALNYADQSHLIKEVKRFTGLSPKKLASRIKREEDDLFITYQID